jgi:hypothetical protein
MKKIQEKKSTSFDFRIRSQIVFNVFNKHKLCTFLLIFLIIIVAYFIFYKDSNQVNIQSKNREVTQNEDETENTKRLVCDRTTRLENDENVDRALSLIYERLTYFDTGKKIFPHQLINCIKVEVKNIKNETGAEGYFDENSEDIKSNYFPIVIDGRGSFLVDDLSIALLLVHEITHVQQYIDRYNITVNPTNSEMFNKAVSEVSKSRCLDYEVFAFKNQLMFALILNKEEGKSLDYRMLADENLIPQLKIFKSLKNSFNDFSFANNCEKYNTECIEGMVNSAIYDQLRYSEAYDEQCSAYEGSFR